MRIGASTVLIERPSPDAAARRRSSATRARPSASPRRRRTARWLPRRASRLDRVGSLRKCVSAGEALPAADARAWTRRTGIEHHRRHRLDRDAPHLHLARRARRARAQPASRCPATRRRASTTMQPLAPGRSAGSRCRARPAAATSTTRASRTTSRRLEPHRRRLPASTRTAISGYQARTDDMIVSAGYNIAAPEVEGALLQHPAVAECAVVGVADEERGQIVKAFVVLRDGHAGGRRAGRRRCRSSSRQRIAPYKYPRADRVRRRAAADGDGQGAAGGAAEAGGGCGGGVSGRRGEVTPRGKPISQGRGPGGRGS